MWISCVCDDLKEYYLVVQKETHDSLATLFRYRAIVDW